MSIKGSGGSYKAGLFAEQRAIKYLRAKGYHILDQRVRTRTTEMDIVATHQDYVVFIEVKYSKHADMAGYRVDHKKQMRFVEAAKHFMAENPEIMEKFPFCRFDVVLLSDHDIFHLENAFLEE
jgi:putative endonuclease